MPSRNRGSAVWNMVQIYNSMQAESIERMCRSERLIRQVVEVIKLRDQAGAETIIEFVYSHLRDEKQDTPTKEELEEKDRRESIMRKKYGDQKERILAGNKKADELTKDPSRSLARAGAYDDLDADYILHVGGKDVPSKQREPILSIITHHRELKHRENRAAANDWREAKDIEEESAVLMLDKNRKLQRTRNFLFKLRNGRLQTAKGMYKRKSEAKKENTVYRNGSL